MTAPQNLIGRMFGQQPVEEKQFKIPFEATATSSFHGSVSSVGDLHGPGGAGRHTKPTHTASFFIEYNGHLRPVNR
jgi:hypothetical protein